MRTARLDHNPLAGTPPVPMGTCVSQPFHVTTGRVRHPVEENAASAPPLPINVDWRLVLARLAMTDPEVARETGRDRTMVSRWRRGIYSPPPDARRELERLWVRLVGGPLPGQSAPGSRGAAIPAIPPRKAGRPSKAARLAIEKRAEILPRVAEPEDA